MIIQTTKEEALIKIKELVHRFADQYEFYKKPDYNETQTRRDFIDPFWEALGWDVANKSNSLESYREVVHEDRVKVGGATKMPDYSFRLPGGKRMFFLEAKKPHTQIKDDAECAIQVRRYGWSAGLQISILTNFDYFAIYDCAAKTKQTDKASVSRIKQLSYLEYITEFDFLWDTFSRERVQQGGLDKYIQNDSNKKGTFTVDKDFLESLDTWRIELAKNISANNTISEDELNFVVQNTINRIIFLRIAEDRHVEPYGQLKDTIKSGDYYKNIISIYNIADQKYNSGLFDFNKDKISEKITIDNKTIKSIVSELYPPLCPYEFSVMAVEILGSAYEQFLGKEITLSKGGRIAADYKPEVRKAGGVYYTPQYIVEYIVKNTIGCLIENKTPAEIEKIKIVDPACGSGSFLIGAYQYLLTWHKDYYNQNAGQNKAKKNSPLTPTGELATEIKKNILLNNIFGVDLDANAVEVTKLSLLLKCMEGETKESIEAQSKLFHDRILPDLDSNIKCGNSLIDLDYYDNDLDFGEERKVKPFSWEKNFPQVFGKRKNLTTEDTENTEEERGFDVVIGNPPYVKEYTSRETFEHIKKSHLLKYYQGKMDLWYFFVCYGIDILKANGHLGFIVPNNWVTNAGASILRNKVLSDASIKNMVDFGSYMVFEDASIQTMILILEKQKQESYSFDYRKIDIGKPSIEIIKKMLEKEKDEGVIYLKPSVKLSEYIDKYLVFGNIKTERLLNKIKEKQNFILDEKTEVAQGIVAAPDKCFLVEKPFKFNKSELPYLKPYYTSAKKYAFEESNVYIIYLCEKNFGNKKLDSFPNFKKYFEPNKKALKKAKIKYETPNKPYYYLHRERDEKFFIKGEKIISQIRTPIPNFLYTQEEYYGSRALNFIKTERIDNKYLTALLNSKLTSFWLKQKGKIQGDLLKIDKEPLLEIPICDTQDKKVKTKIIKHVDQLLQLYKELQAATLPNQKEQLQAKIGYNEDQINKLVYELYGLSEEEVKTIEGSQ